MFSYMNTLLNIYYMPNTYIVQKVPRYMFILPVPVANGEQRVDSDRYRIFTSLGQQWSIRGNRG